MMITILREHGRAVAYFTLALVIGLVLLALVLRGGSPDVVEMGGFWGKLSDAPAEVREAYLYALEHPDVLAYIPCYCGCEQIGHRSNLNCFVAGIDPQGQPIFASHGYG